MNGAVAAFRENDRVASAASPGRHGTVAARVSTDSYMLGGALVMTVPVEWDDAERVEGESYGEVTAELPAGLRLVVLRGARGYGAHCLLTPVKHAPMLASTNHEGQAPA